MLKELRVKNFALIRNLQLEFQNQFTVITGETGAGKSILLGALGLIMGKRANTSILLDTDKKCIVEAIFLLKDLSLEKTFEEYDLDFEKESIIRREISPNGKSRAFINDTPVNLKTLTLISKRLIDIHSQHQTLEINQEEYQINLLDKYALAEVIYEKYLGIFSHQKELEKILKEREEEQKKLLQEYDYNQFLLEEFEDIELEPSLFEEAKSQLEIVKNAEKIKNILFETSTQLAEGEDNTISKIRTITSLLEEITAYSNQYVDLRQRLHSVMIELEDIANEIEEANESVDFNPDTIENLQNQVDEIFRLQQKHRVNTVEELKEIKEKIDEKLLNYTFIEAKILKDKDALLSNEKILQKQAKLLSEKRTLAAQKMNKQVLKSLQDLGMPDARFEIKVEVIPQANRYGKNKISYLFSANKGNAMQDISKTASGGELSRLLLSIKAAIASKTKLPTIIFDEIDSGISGEIAKKMAVILKKMSANIQLLSITHLPQIAAKGDSHLKVSKIVKKEKTETLVSYLDNTEREEEIAKMIGGENFTETTLKTAIELLK